MNFRIKKILIVFIICFACAGAVACARKAPAASLELALKQHQDSLSRGGHLRSAEQKQVAVLLSENEKIRAVMAGFRPEDPGYDALAEALAENNASLAKLGYGRRPVTK